MKKRFLLMAILAGFLAACGGPPPTPYPTYTRYPTYTPYPTLTSGLETIAASPTPLPTEKAVESADPTLAYSQDEFADVWAIVYAARDWAFDTREIVYESPEYPLIREVTSTCAEGSCFSSLAAAIQSAPPGTLITVTDQGNYTESLVITTNEITLDCQGATLQGNGTGIGIDLVGVRLVTIRNCVINGFNNGITLKNSHQNVIYLNRLVGNGDRGIAMWGSDLNIIDTNSIFDTDSAGIILDGDCKQNVIVRNSIDKSGDSGLGIFDGSNDNVVIQNSIQETRLHEGLGVHRAEGNVLYLNEFRGNIISGVLLEDCTGSNYVFVNEFHLGSGISFTNVSNAYIFENYFHDAPFGIAGTIMNQSLFIANRFMNLESTAIDLDDSSDNLIAYNVANNNGEAGIKLVGHSHGNIIRQNHLCYNARTDIMALRLVGDNNFAGNQCDLSEGPETFKCAVSCP